MLSRTASDSSYLSGALPGVLVLGLGLAVTVAPLTATALGSVTDDRAGLASAVNNDVARVGGLVAVAVIPALAGIAGRDYLHPSKMAGGFRTAVFITASWCVAGGVLAALGIRNPDAVHAEAAEGSGHGGGGGDRCLHCALDATPLSADS